MRPKEKKFFNSFVVIILWFAIALVANLLFAERNIIRYDLTESGKYSLSEHSIKVASQLDQPLKITYYLSQEVPQDMVGLERYASDLFKEYQAYSRENLEYEIIHPLKIKNIATEEVEAEKKYDHGIRESLVQHMSTRGIPLSLEQKKTGSNSFHYFSSIRLEYLGKVRIIENVDKAESLEYRLTNAIDKLIAFKPTKVAFYAPGLTMDTDNKEFGTIIYRIWKLHQTENLKLGKDQPVPKDVDVLIVMASRKIKAPALYQIDQYLQRGGKAIFLTQIFKPTQKNMVLSVKNAPPGYWKLPAQLKQRYFRQGAVEIERYWKKADIGLSEFLKHYGIKINPVVLNDPGENTCLTRENVKSLGWIRKVKKKEIQFFPHLIRVLPENGNENYGFTRNLDNLYFVVPHSYSPSFPEKMVDYTTLLTTSNSVVKFEYKKKPLKIETPRLRGRGKVEVLPVLSHKEFMAAIGREGKKTRVETEKYLFSLPRNVINSLDQEKISKPLRENFSRRQVDLSRAAQVEVVAEGSQWEIHDGEKTWIIRAERMVLNVYRKKKKEDLAVLVRGKFSPYFTHPPGEEREKDEKKRKKKLQPSQHKATIVALADLTFLSDMFLNHLSSFNIKDPSAPRFFVELIEWLASGESLAQIRTKHFESRPLKELTEKEEGRWRIFFALSMPIVVILFGLVWLMIRKREGQLLPSPQLQGAAQAAVESATDDREGDRAGGLSDDGGD